MEFYFALYRMVVKFFLVEMVEASAKIIPVVSIAICASALIISSISIMRDEKNNDENSGPRTRKDVKSHGRTRRTPPYLDKTA